MLLHRCRSNNVTVIQNRFIDEYMISANGEFVKVYLLLLRCASSDEEFSLSMIADVLNHTEGDVKRALSYWEKMHLLQLSFDDNGNLTDITFTEPNSLEEHSQKRVAQYAAGVSSIQDKNHEGSVSKDKEASDAKTAPSQRIYITASRKLELGKNEEVKELLYVANQYLSRPLTATDVNHILYFYDELHLPADVIAYLLEYCAERGNKSIQYIRTVAFEWAKKGLTTVEEAKKDSALYHKDYYTILKSFGIKNRGPADAEVTYMNNWMNQMGFSLDLILEACNRTITRIHNPSFPYADSILQDWHKKNIKTIAELESLPRVTDTADSEAASKPASSGKSRSRDFGFKPREYDYDQLEGQLLNY